MKILFVGSECTPLAKVGGLGDVIGSLPKALKELGVDVRICLPKYQVIDFEQYKFELITKEIRVKEEKINIYQGFLPVSPVGGPSSRVVLYLLENEKFFGENGIYFERSAFVSSFKEIQRFLFFSQAILEIFKELNWQPQIIHCHDWHTAIVPLLLNTKCQIPNTKTLLTIHNLANQGKWKAKEIFDFLGLKGGEIESLKIQDKEGNLNILQQGILNADLINTVSPTYSREILTKEYGEGLETTLLKRKKGLFGILNGIDTRDFDPEDDPNLKVNYSVLDFEKKRENKLDLQKSLKLPENEKIPLLGFVGRLDSQKGIDLILKIIPELVKLKCQLVILGVGKEEYEESFRELAKRYPLNISSQIMFDSILAKKIYSGSDFFLIPSRFEPCGLGAMIAQRYGSIPIAREIGGLAEIVKEGKTGFLFKEYNTGAFLNSIKKALEIFKKKNQLNKMIKLVMEKDVSWALPAKEYLSLYEKLLNPVV